MSTGLSDAAAGADEVAAATEFPFVLPVSGDPSLSLGPEDSDIVWRVLVDCMEGPRNRRACLLGFRKG